ASPRGPASADCRSRPVTPRVRRSAESADEADAAEVVVARGPPPDTPSVRLEPCQRRVVYSGFCVDGRPDGVEARPLDGGIRGQPLVEDPCDRAEESRP